MKVILKMMYLIKKALNGGLMMLFIRAIGKIANNMVLNCEK